MRTHLAAWLGFFAVLAIQPALGRAEAIQQISGTWSGHYYYPEAKNEKGEVAPRKGIEFLAKLRVAGKGFAGEISERALAHPGDPKEIELHAFVKGFVTHDGDVEFTKEYDGTGDWSHQVKYSGKLADDRKTIKGEWRIGVGNDSAAGAFDMQLKAK